MFVKVRTHPSLGFDILQLTLGTLPDALTPPELHPHPRVRERHWADRQEVQEDDEEHVVSEDKIHKQLTLLLLAFQNYYYIRFICRYCIFCNESY